MVHGNDPFLNVEAGTGLVGAADEDPDQALIHHPEQFFLALICPVMDKGDLGSRNAEVVNQLIAQRIIHIELTGFWRSNVTEDDLRSFVVCAFQV